MDEARGLSLRRRRRRRRAAPVRACASCLLRRARARLHATSRDGRVGLSAAHYDYDLLQVHVVIPLATCLRNGYAIPLGYAEFSV
jgi:hypothetical protein